MTDLVALARKHKHVAVTHYKGCEADHIGCLVNKLADEVERQNAVIEKLVNEIEENNPSPCIVHLP